MTVMLPNPTAVNMSDDYGPDMFTDETAKRRNVGCHVALPSFNDLSPSDNWRKNAACKGMDVNIFFPDKPGVTHAAEAVEVCGRCCVAAECAVAGSALSTKGVWGGTVEAQRASHTITATRDGAVDDAEVLLTRIADLRECDTPWKTIVATLASEGFVGVAGEPVTLYGVQSWWRARASNAEFYNPVTPEAKKLICDAGRAGVKWKTVAENANAAGYLTSRGSAWTGGACAERFKLWTNGETSRRSTPICQTTTDAIIGMRNNGETYPQIAAALNAAGFEHPRSRGGKWGLQQVAYFCLCNAGLITYTPVLATPVAAVDIVTAMRGEGATTNAIRCRLTAEGLPTASGVAWTNRIVTHLISRLGDVSHRTAERNAEQAQAMAIVVSMRAEGSTFRAIGVALNTAGLRNRTGDEWKFESVRGAFRRHQQQEAKRADL